MATGSKAGSAGDGSNPAPFDWKSILVSAPVPPKVVELLPPNGSPVVKRRIEANADVYLSISVLSFYHPEARRGLTKQVPLIFADATWRRPTDEDLPQVAVMGPNPEAHPNMAKHGNYAFGGRTFFGPERFDGSVDFSIGLHLFKSNAAGRKLIDVARAGSKMLPKGDMLILGGLADAGIDGALKGLKQLLPDKQTPWIVGVINSLATAGNQTFETGTWAAIEGGGADPGQVYLDSKDNLLRDLKGKPLQRPYVVYSVDATDTNPDRLRIGGIPKARQRLREAHKSGANVSDAKLGDLFRQFCGEVELSDELTQRDRDEIIADARMRFERLMAQRAAFNFDDNAALFPSQEVSPSVVSAFRADKPEAEKAADAQASISASLEALANPDALPDDEGMSALVTELYTAVSDYAALVRSNPEAHRKQVKEVAKKLRNRREFKALLALATQVRDGGVDIGWLHYYGAAADIELNGAPSLEDLARAAKGQQLPQMMGEAFLAKAIQLSGKDFENDADLLSDCLGLQGRIWKQRAVRAREVNDDMRMAFERAYAFYRQGMDAGTDVQFHQVNILGLMHAAQKLGIVIGRKGDAAKWAREILKAIKKGGTSADWNLANAGDAALYLGREPEAIGFYTAYLEEAKDKPFALNATRRQLVEMWGVDPKGNTDLCNIVRLMAQLSMRSIATVSLSIDEVEAMAQTVQEDDRKLEALLGGPPAIPAKDIRELLRYSQSVGKVCAPNGRAVGTGFLLHGRHVHGTLANEFVFFTNDHVICDAKTYAGSIRSAEACIFFEDLNPDDIYQVKEVFWRSDSHNHDCAILRLHKQPEGLQAEIEPAEYLLPRQNTEAGKAETDAAGRASRVYIIGHPDGRGIEITFEHNYIVDHELKSPVAKATPQPVRIHYRAPTEPGSSGSPVLSAFSRKLIGLHHSTTEQPLGRQKKPNEEYKANEGLWIQSILAAVRAEKGEAPAPPPPGAAAPVVSPAPAATPAPVAAPAPAAPAAVPAAPEAAPVSPAPVVSPAPAIAPVAAAATAGHPESNIEDDTAFFENVDGREDTAENGYAGMEPQKLESGAAAVSAYSALSPKPKARWAPHAEHPDTQHLAHLPINLNNGMGFTLSGAVLRHALAIASTPVPTSGSRRVLFGIRGALPNSAPKEGATPEFLDQAAMSETDPDHVGYLCTMGVWDLDTDKVWVCPGSTVPAIGYLWHATQATDPARFGWGANMLSPGVYSHVVGTHANGGKTRQPGAFRQNAKLCVMRLASAELSFRTGNIAWDVSSDAKAVTIWDNIHAGLIASPSWGAEHYSAGCQVVKGTVTTLDRRDTPSGYWASFRLAAGLNPKPYVSPVPASTNRFAVQTTEDGKVYPYILLTAREVRIASENLTSPPSELKFFKLRRGSQGDMVKALQAALGVKPDGDFGYLTQRALIQKQIQLTGQPDGVVTAANAAAFGLT